MNEQFCLIFLQSYLIVIQLFHSIDIMSVEAQKNNFLTDQLEIQLKKLRKKICKLTKKRDQRIKNIERQTIRKNIQMNIKINKIVSGQKIVPEIFNFQQVSSNQHEKSILQNNSHNIKELAQTRNEGIHNYWKNILLATYKDCMKKQQLSILDNLKEISVKDYNNDKCSIFFSFRNGHHILPQGNYTKTIFKNKKGQPISYQGDQVSNSHKLKKGFFKILLKSTKQVKKLKIIWEFIEIMSTQIIPRSLTYYLMTRVKQNPELLSYVDSEESDQ